MLQVNAYHTLTKSSHLVLHTCRSMCTIQLELFVNMAHLGAVLKRRSKGCYYAELSNNFPVFLGEHDKASLELEAHSGDVNLIRPNFGFSLPLLVGNELSHTVLLIMHRMHAVADPTFSIADPGSRVDKNSDPDLHHRV